MARTTKRKRIGQPRQRICTPGVLWARCLQYFRMVDRTPQMIVRTVYRDGKKVKVPVPRFRPYRVVDLCAYLGCSVGHMQRAVRRADTGDGGVYEDVFARAKLVIEAQNEAGAMMHTMYAGPAARRLNARDLNERRKAKREAADSSPIAEEG